MYIWFIAQTGVIGQARRQHEHSYVPFRKVAGSLLESPLGGIPGAQIIQVRIDSWGYVRSIWRGSTRICKAGNGMVIHRWGELLEGEWKRALPCMQTLPVCVRDVSFTDSKEVSVNHRQGAEGCEIGRPREPPQDVVCMHVSTQLFTSMAKRKVWTHRTVRQDWRAAQKNIIDVFELNVFVTKPP